MTSFGAWPACEPTIMFESRTTAAPSTVTPPIPYGRPTHQAASRQSAHHIRLISGERKSVSSATIPTPCRSSEFCG